MPVLDRREPGVYVSIEDASYAAPTLESGRTVYMAGLCPKGPHNRIFEITGGQRQFQNLFGQPNFKKTSQTHYLADKALQYGARVLYIRTMPDDSNIANAVISTNSESNETNIEFPVFTFTTGIIPKLSIGGNLLLEADLESGEIVYKMSEDKYYTYGGTTITAGTTLVYNEILDSSDDWTEVINDGKTITVDLSSETGEPTAVDNLEIGDWIFYGGTGSDDEHTSNEACQITNIVVAADGASAEITLSDDYVDHLNGSDQEYVGQAVKYSPFIASNNVMAQDLSYPEGDTNDDTDGIVYLFHAIGAGDYGNNYKIIASRNTEMEKMFTYEDSSAEVINGNARVGDSKYKYMFANIGLYEQQDDGTDRLIEGPWIVSLAENTPEGQTIRNLSDGTPMYIVDVINRNSQYIRIASGGSLESSVLATNTVEAEKNRLNILLLMAGATPVGTDNYVESGNSLNFAGGDNGTGDVDGTIDLYDSKNRLVIGDAILGKIKLAYQGALTSVDGSIEQIKEVTYPWYRPDYIVSGGFPAWVQDGARFLAEYREDCIHLGDTGSVCESFTQDLSERLNSVGWNNWTSALYVQYRKIKDAYTGMDFWVTPVYHALERHLAIDAISFVGEPVAGIEKGAITEPIELRYRANHTERGDLIDAELNPVIVEPDGKYILTQFTTWKRLSVMKRLHVAKFVAYCRKMIPPLLKDILQRKATSYWVNQAQSRVQYFLSNFQGSSVERYNILNGFSVNCDFDETSSELNLYVTLNPIRAIEKINVYIVVQ
jgi:hypothetical protein